MTKAIRISRGNVRAAARALSVSAWTLHHALSRFDLRPLADRLRSLHHQKGPRAHGSSAAEKERILAALDRYGWKIQETATHLHVHRDTVRKRMLRLGIERSDWFHLPSATRRESLRAALHSTSWSTRRAAEQLGIEEGTCRRQMKRLGLERPVIPTFSQIARQVLVVVLERVTWDTREAAQHFSVSPSHLRLRMRGLGIKRPKREPERDPEQLRRLVDALRLSNGVVVTAARTLGVSPPTVDNWCRKFEVEPREFRMK